MRLLQRVGSAIVDALVPEECVACDAALERRGALLCAGCTAQVRVPSPRLVADVQAFAPFAYAEPVKTLIHRFKYQSRPEYARRLAANLAATPCLPLQLLQGATLVPVPVHPKRLAERGYNQAALLASALAPLLRGHVQPRALKRQHDAPRQALLDREQRALNMAEQVTARSAPRGNVVLVDDVLTTGATAGACLNALRKAGAHPVALLTIAIAE
jgi:ComF family protein